MAKTNLYITRHGSKKETYTDIWTGKLDVELSEKGLLQAENLGKILSDEIKFDVVICSTMIRGRDTAKKTVEHLNYDVELIEYDELREMSHGDVEGHTNEEFEKKFPEILEAWNRNEDVRFPNGENFEDVEKRVVPVINSVIKKYEGKNILFVGHKSVNMVLIGYLLHIPRPFRYIPQQENCFLTLFQFLDDGTKKLKFLNIDPKSLKSYKLK